MRLQSTSKHHRSAIRASAAVMALTFVALAPSAYGAQPFRMVAAVNAPGGDQIVKGDYEAAVRRARADRSSAVDVALWRATNLCVAYTMTGQAEDATGACDRAVELSRLPAAAGYSPANRGVERAWVHVNRGVERWLAGDLAAAEADFTTARAHAPQADFVKDNAAAFEARMEAVARLSD